MTLGDRAAPEHADEIAALLVTIHSAEQRLQDLTGGEVDSFLDDEGRTFVLRAAQDRRRREADRQAGILNTLPAHIALIDVQGSIVSVNERWQQFAIANLLSDPAFGIATNYLAVCDRAEGVDSAEAREVAAGIRSVLEGRTRGYTVEYPCHSPDEQRWFLLTVTPLSNDSRDGAVVMHSNITERIEAERAMRELSAQTARREKVLNTTLSSISDFAYIFDREGRVVFANQSLLDLWGIPLEAAEGKNFIELGYPSDMAAMLTDQVQEVFRTGRIVTDETPYISPAGQHGFYEYIYSPSIAADGSVEFVVGSTRDITQRKLSAEALRNSELEQRQLALQLVIETSRLTDAQRVAKIGSWETDLQTMTVLWSEETYRIFEVDPSEGMNHERFLAFVHPADREKVQSAFLRSVGQDSDSSVEHRLLLPGDQIKFVEERWLVLFDEQGAPLRAIGSCQDITERRLAENALQQSQGRMREIFDGLGPSMFVALLTPEGIVVEINRSPLEAAGLKVEDVTGKPFAETHWWAHAPAAQLQLREAIAKAARGEASRFDTRVQGAEGIVIDLDFSLRPLRDDAGQVIFLIQSASVITERKRAEHTLRQAQKLEAVGQLAAGVAHEFNNILQTLMSMATLIRLRGAQPEIVKIGTDMEVQIRRGAGVTRQLLLSSRHEESEKMKLDLRDEVLSASELLRRLIPENISLVVETAPDRASVDCNAGQIQQVLLNLAINARDAMPDGGTLTMRVLCSGPEIFLEIEDDGSGFDDAIRERLFDPFFTTKELGKGTGLGLAVVYGIIEQHGGRIEVRSRPGEGTRFRVILPAAVADEVGAELSAAGQITAGSGRVLLVEDEEGVREGITMLLEMIGFVVTAVSRGEDAIALPRLPAPDLLLSDVTLPGIGGPALARILGERWPHLKVTLMSGYVDANTRAQALEQGWNLLEKPFELDDLARHLGVASLASGGL